MIHRLFLALALLFAPAAALGDEGLEGAWALRIDGAVIFRFELDRAEDGEWHGVWTRPDSFASNGEVFQRLTGSEDLPSSAGLDFAGMAELTFDDPRPNAVPDIFRFIQLDDDRAQLEYVGTGLAPYPLVRVARGTALGPFAAGRVYDRDRAESDPAAVPAPPVAADPPAAAPAPQEPAQPDRIGADFLEGL